MAILVGIDTEDTEVACVARPYPVVGVAAKLADVAWRAAHETDIGVDLVEQQIVFIAQEIRFDADFILGLFFDRGNDFFDVLVNFGLTFTLRHVNGDASQHFFSHVAHLAEEDDAEARAR